MTNAAKLKPAHEAAPASRASYGEAPEHVWSGSQIFSDPLHLPWTRATWSEFPVGWTFSEPERWMHSGCRRRVLNPPN
jgi:hypothetical protein